MFAQWYQGQKETSLAWLQDLHRHPEVGFEVHRTAGFVAECLADLGYDVATGVGRAGVVATLHGAHTKISPGRVVAFRAELDALPMEERASVAYRSTLRGRFHGCGHDGHIITALTAAAFLSRHRELAGAVRFVFQPAEELLAGARAMLADGLLERFPFDEIYGLHNLPGVAPGHVAIPATTALASADNVDVAIRAHGAHGAMPHTGADAVLAAAGFITTVQQATTRVLDARDAGVISFGRIESGGARNILPELVRVEGTVRAGAAPVRERLAALLRDAAKAVERLYGVEVALDIAPVAPPAMNHADAVAAVAASANRVTGGDKVTAQARGLMASDDFAEFLNRRPGAFFFIGQDGHAPHHPEYAFDPEIIPLGAAILADLATTRTAPFAA